MLLTGFRSIRILPTLERLTSFMGNEGWFIGALYGGILSSAVANLFKLTINMELMFGMINISVVVVALALCGEPGARIYKPSALEKI